MREVLYGRYYTKEKAHLQEEKTKGEIILQEKILHPVTRGIPHRLTEEDTVLLPNEVDHPRPDEGLPHLTLVADTTRPLHPIVEGGPVLVHPIEGGSRTGTTRGGEAGVAAGAVLPAGASRGGRPVGHHIGGMGHPTDTARGGADHHPLYHCRHRLPESQKIGKGLAMNSGMDINDRQSRCLQWTRWHSPLLPVEIHLMCMLK
jgi:hypothetical protein